MEFKRQFIDIRPFSRLEEIVKEKMPLKHSKFNFDNNAIISEINKLGYIVQRYVNEKEFIKKDFERMHTEAERLRKLFPHKKIIKGKVNQWGIQAIIARNLIILDAESFFIFARILLDKIPSLLGPLYKGIVTQTDVSTKNFLTHINWFEKNSKYVFDQFFLEKMIEFRKLFYEKIRAPRNELIVHNEWKHISDWINYDGTIIRRRYKLYIHDYEKNWRIEESKELPEISKLFHEIIEFLEFLNEYFFKKILEFTR